MENLCPQYMLLALNMADFILMNKNEDDIKKGKLYILRESLIDHLDDCRECVTENKAERNSTDDPILSKALSFTRALKKNQE